MPTTDVGVVNWCEHKECKPIKMALLGGTSSLDDLCIPPIIHLHTFLYIPAQTIKFIVRVTVSVVQQAVPAQA